MRAAILLMYGMHVTVSHMHDRLARVTHRGTDACYSLTHLQNAFMRGAENQSDGEHGFGALCRCLHTLFLLANSLVACMQCCCLQTLLFLANSAFLVYSFDTFKQCCCLQAVLSFANNVFPCQQC